MSITLPHDWFERPVPDNVEIGDRSWLYSSFAFLHYHSRRPRGVRLGHDTGVYAGSFFELGPAGEVDIGDHSTLVGAIIASNGRVAVGSYVFVAHEVVIADTFTASPLPPGAGVLAAPGAASDDEPSVLSIEIGDDVWIGARAVVLGGARIGRGSIVGAGAVVQGVVPAYSVVAGNPARVVASVPHGSTTE